jgi:signal transduction histidine kinase
MSEVSCRQFDFFFVALEKKGLPAAALLDGTGYTEKELRDKNKRVPWKTWLAVAENAKKIWSDEELIDLAGMWVESPAIRYLRAISGALFTPKQIFERVAAKGRDMCSNTTTHYLDLGPDRLALDLRIEPPHAQSDVFFLLCEGGFRELPRLAGKPRATIVRTPIDGGQRFEIQLAPGSDRVSRARRFVRWFTASRSVANELDEMLDDQRLKFEEIVKQREKLARQAAQLKTAHAVNELVQHELDLDLTIASITSALVGEAGFARAEVVVDCVSDGVAIQRSFEHGAGGAVALERPLEGRIGRTGKLTVWSHATNDVSEREELLSFILPSVIMAIDNAISFLVLDDYRRSLEIRVKERTAELVKAKEARDRIFANINHDLRSPLSLILLAVAEARQSGVQSAMSERTLGAIEHGARRVLRMVDELLILAEGRENDVKLATARCDLGRMSAAVAEAWKLAAQQASLTLEHDCEPSTIVVAEPNALERILANLVSNALKFTPTGGRVTLSVRAEMGAAVLEVADNGAGIDDELKARLFGRFERGEAVRKAAIGGSGLGLSLVKELTEAHGGSVRVLDTPGGGATFRVELPLAAGAEGGDIDVRAGESGPKLGPADFGMRNGGIVEPKIYEARSGSARATILLAEDDPSLRDHTATLLSEIYRVITAPDGVSALALAKDHSPDLLITDVQMPGMDGIELTKRFRALPNNRMAPVLILTTFDAVCDKLAGFDAGAIDHISKPFEPEELRARVRSQLAIRALALQLLETEKLAALGTLSAGLAHEIRNPANGIVNAVAPLRELLPPEAVEPGSPAAELLDVIEHCSNQVGALSRELLGFKRGVELKRAGIPLDSLLRRVKTTMQHTLDGVQLRENLQYTGPIRCAEPLFAQVLTNLIENGAHAAGRGGWVEIRSGLEEQRVVLEVTDSGPGVPEELRERIFEPFFTTKPAGAGTGLGLSTARDIALRHGGTLDVLRGTSARSIFRLTMPLES